MSAIERVTRHLAKHGAEHGKIPARVRRDLLELARRAKGAAPLGVQLSPYMQALLRTEEIGGKDCCRSSATIPSRQTRHAAPAKQPH